MWAIFGFLIRTEQDGTQHLDNFKQTHSQTNRDFSRK